MADYPTVRTWQDNPRVMAVINAAVDVSCYQRDHEYPKEGSPEWFTFAEKLNTLREALRQLYPNAGQL